MTAPGYDAEIAARHLTEACDIMAGLVSRIGPCTLPALDHPPFGTLASSIIGQQLSIKAAQTIEARVLALTGRLEPASILAVEVDGLRACGLSAAKVRYLWALSEAVAAGRLDFEALATMEETDAVKALVALPGIGPWTAEMFLIFGLKRPDVLSVGDAGLQRASRDLYGKPLEEIADRFRPYRSVASWYLWRHLDVVPVET